MSSIVIILDALRKCTVKVTPSTTLQAALVDACTKLKLNASDYALSVNNQELDLSLPYRLSNLTPNQKVQLQKRKTSANASVIIALQLENGDRLQQSFLSNVTFSDLLRFWESKLSLNTSQNWVIQYMNQEYPLSVFQTTTLSSIGLTSGSGLLRLLQKNTSSPSPVHKQEPKDVTTNVTANVEEEKSEENAKMEVEEEEPVVEIPEHRNVQVVMPTGVTDNNDVDESFYEVTMDDLAYLVAMEKKSREAKDLLLTKKLREQFKNVKRYKKSDIRIKFPDRVQIQGTFGGNTTTEELVAWIRDQLDVNETFYLYTAPPLKRLENAMTLDEQKLVPAALVHLAWENKELNEKPTIELLKKQTIEIAKENEAKQEPKAVEEEIKVSSGKEEEVDKKSPAPAKNNAPVPKWLKMGGNKR